MGLMKRTKVVREFGVKWPLRDLAAPTAFICDLWSICDVEYYLSTVQ